MPMSGSIVASFHWEKNCLHQPGCNLGKREKSQKILNYNSEAQWSKRLQTMHMYFLLKLYENTYSILSARMQSTAIVLNYSIKNHTEWLTILMRSIPDIYLEVNLQLNSQVWGSLTLPIVPLQIDFFPKSYIGNVFFIHYWILNAVTSREWWKQCLSL